MKELFKHYPDKSRLPTGVTFLWAAAYDFGWALILILAIGIASIDFSFSDLLPMIGVRLLIFLGYVFQCLVCEALIWTIVYLVLNRKRRKS